MSPKLPLLLALLATADAAGPTSFDRRTDQGVTIDVPTEWKLLVQKDTHNVTMSAGLATSLTLYWYDYASGATPDIMLDILVETVKEQLPIGELKPGPRAWIPDAANPWELVRGKQMTAEVTALGYSMRLGLVALVDQPNGRMMAAFLLAPPDEFTALGGPGMLGDVVASLALDGDPLRPTPAWYWHAEPPDAVARPATPAPEALAARPVDGAKAP